MKSSRSNVISVSIKAVLENSDYVTADNINALTGGHGGLVVAAACAANSIADYLLRGKTLH